MAINYNNIEQELNKADYIVRLIAYLIDIVILGTFTVIVNLVMIVSSYLSTGEIFWVSAGFHISLMLLIVFVCSILYSVVAISVWRATVGKSLMHIEVTTIIGRELTLKQIICREFIGRTLCKLSLFSGFAMMFYNVEGFGFHDKIANTMVVKKGEDLMELAVGKEILKKALLEDSENERYNRIYNRGINAKLSGGAVPFVPNQEVVVPTDPSQLRMRMSQYAEQVVVPEQMYGCVSFGQQANMDMYGVIQDAHLQQQMSMMQGMPLQEMSMMQEVPLQQMPMMQGMPLQQMHLIQDNSLEKQQVHMEQSYEMGIYQDALQNVVDEHSLMEECQQHLQFHT